MKKCNIFKKLICLLLMVAVTTTVPVNITAEESGVSCASVTFGKSMSGNRAQAVISTNPKDDNYALVGEKHGRECVITQVRQNETGTRNGSISSIPVLVDDDYISSNDKNIVVKLTYYDRDWDTIHITYKTAGGSTYNHDIVKYATNTWRVATIVLRNPSLNGTLAHNADLLISAAEDTLIRETEYISKIEIVNLDKSYTDANASSKADILHITEARVLSDMGLLDGFTLNNEKYGLNKALTLEEALKSVIKLCFEGTDELKNSTCAATDVSEKAKPYIGLAINKGLITLKDDGTIGASKIVTLKELLDMYVFFIKGSFPNDTLGMAKSLGLVKNLTRMDEHGITGSGIFNVVPGMWAIETNNLSRYAYLDDLAAISYAMMDMTVSNSQKKVMANLFDRGAFKRDSIVNSGVGDLLYKFYRQTGFNIVEESYVDSDTGVTVNTLKLPGLPSAGGYAHSMNMSADGKKIVIGAGIDTSSNYCTLVVYDRETKKTTPLHPDMKESYHYGFMVAPNVGKVYYNCAREVYEFDLKTMTNRYITSQGSSSIESLWCGVPSVSDDGEILVQFKYDRNYTQYGKTSGRPLSFDIINTKTGEITTPFSAERTLSHKSPRGDYTVYGIGHVTVNPVHKNLFSYIVQYEEASSPKELWIYSSDTDTHTCVYSDHVNENGVSDESTAHWVWSEEGKKSYFIKYAGSDYIDGLPGVGIAWTDNVGNSDKSVMGYVNGDYNYNHVGVSPNDRYFVGDNTSRWNGERFESKVVLIDGKTGKSRLLANKIGIWVNHPGHVHPLISEDCSTVSFTMAGDNHHLMVAYIELKTLPELNEKKHGVAYASFGETNFEKGIELYHEYYDRAWYSNIDVLNTIKGGKSCLEIAPKHKAPFEVLAQYVDADERTVTFRIEYFDNGTEPIDFLYNSSHLEETTYNRKYWKYSIKRENTNKWRVAEFTLTDVCFNGAGAGNADFTVSALDRKTPVYIKEIYASPGNNIQWDDDAPIQRNGITYGQPKYYKGSKLLSSPIGQTGDITVELTVGNTQDVPMNVTFIVAAYNKADNGMTSVDFIDKQIPPESKVQVSRTVNVPDKNHEIRYYLWKDMKTIVPFSTDALDVSLPQAPEQIILRDVTTSSALLSWRGAEDNKSIFGYEIYRDDFSEPIALTRQTEYIDASLSSNTEYSYYIKTVDISGQRSAPSEKIVVKTYDVASIAVNTSVIDMDKKIPGTSGYYGVGEGHNIESMGLSTNIYTCRSTIDEETGLVINDTSVPTYATGTYKGRDCFALYSSARRANALRFNVDDDYAYNSNDLSIELTYFDNSTEDITFHYYTTENANSDDNSFRAKDSGSVVLAAREGTDKWVTKTITIDNACFDNRISTYGCDFYFDVKSDAVLYISDITVAKNHGDTYISLDSDGYARGSEYMLKPMWSSTDTCTEGVNYGITTAPDGVTQAFFLKRTDSPTQVKLCIDVDDRYIDKYTTRAKVRITYWDEIKNSGKTNRVKIDYAGYRNDGVEIENIYEMPPHAITGDGKCWKTCEFVLDNIAFNSGYENYKKTGDFRINTVYGSPTHSLGETLYISKIEVIKIP